MAFANAMNSEKAVGRNRFLEIAQYFYLVVQKGMVVISGVFLHMMVVIVSYDVLMRYFLKRATFWAGEIATYMMLYITLFTTAWLVRKNRHVKIAFFLKRVSSRAQKTLACITSLIAAGVCVTLTCFGIFSTIYFMDYKTPTLLALPKGSILIAIPIGFFFTAVEFAIRAFESMRECRKS